MTTGFANYFCKAIIANYWREDFSEEEARKILIECFKVIFNKKIYRLYSAETPGHMIESKFQLSIRMELELKIQFK